MPRFADTNLIFSVQCPRISLIIVGQSLITLCNKCNSLKSVQMTYLQCPLTTTCFIRFINGLILCFILIMPAVSQPSGGPYGPVRQSWPLPEAKGQIYYVSPDGNRESTGGTLSVPTTIEAAIERVKTGDVIVMRGRNISHRRSDP